MVIRELIMRKDFWNDEVSVGNPWLIPTGGISQKIKVGDSSVMVIVCDHLSRSVIILKRMVSWS